MWLNSTLQVKSCREEEDNRGELFNMFFGIPKNFNRMNDPLTFIVANTIFKNNDESMYQT